jgi:transposase
VTAVPQPYSEGLRRKILEACERQEGSLAELAVFFSVRHGYPKKIRQQRRCTGLKTVPVPPRLAPPKVTLAVEQQVAELWQAQPDANSPNYGTVLWPMTACD